MGSLVVVDEDKGAVADFQRRFLQLFGYEKIFAQPPIDKGAVGGDVHHFHMRRFTQHRRGTFGGGDEAIFTIGIDKYLQNVADFQALVGVAFG